jgi:hypothetical protein
MSLAVKEKGNSVTLVTKDDFTGKNGTQAKYAGLTIDFYKIGNICFAMLGGSATSALTSGTEYSFSIPSGFESGISNVRYADPTGNGYFTIKESTITFTPTKSITTGTILRGFAVYPYKDF